jgi:uncharacterized protein YqjF (DUF2071 family)
MHAPFLTAEWKNLILANYIIDPDLLQPWLPAKTEIDFFNGKTYVSLVGFQFYNTRLRGIKIPFHVNFIEVNLRFYVRYKDGTLWKRGTVFISEIVPRAAISFVANNVYHENYRTMKMTHYIQEEEKLISAGYHWKYRNSWNQLRVIADPKAAEIPFLSEEEFITEHYWGYSKQRNSVTIQYEVAHPRWMMYPVKDYSINVNFSGLYGSDFLLLNDSKPSSVIFAKGSEISVYKKTKL